MSNADRKQESVSNASGRGTMAALLRSASLDPPGLAEVRRICALPVFGPLTPTEVEVISREEATSSAFAAGFRLWEPQARALLAFRSERGVFCPLHVGGGKTIIAALCAKHQWQESGGRAKILLHVPSRVFVQVLTRDLPLARRMIGLDLPVHGLGGVDRETRLKIAHSGRRGLYVMPYSLLSTEDTDEVLAAIDPDLVIADEAHNLRRRTGAARTRRWLAMMNARPRRLVALSGTMHLRSLLDSHHMISLALGKRSPLPVERPFAEYWAEALDSGAPAATPEHAKVLEPLGEWARAQVARRSVPAPGGPLTSDAQGWRRAYRLRRDTVPGVIASDEESLGVSLFLQNLPATDDLTEEARLAFEEGLYAQFPPGEEGFVPQAAFSHLGPLRRLQALLWATQAHWKTPNGDEIEYAIHGYKWRYELSAGFYNELVWPTEEALARSRRCVDGEAATLLAASRRWFEAHQRYARGLRDFLEGTHVQGLDTPMLVGAEIARGAARVPAPLAALWHHARDLDFDGRVERVSQTVRVCDWKIQRALEWVRGEIPASEGALIWVHNVEMGIWATEILREALGDRVVHAPAGSAADRRFLDPDANRKVMVCSLPAHGESKNLQAFRHQFFLQWPRSAKAAEQGIGRTHRYGQEADELVVNTCLSLEFDHQLFCATLHDALHAHTTDHRMKLIYASYVDLPRMYPSDFLIERGFEAQRLSAEQAKMLPGAGDA